MDVDIKGFTLPFDVGIQLSTVPDSQITQVSSYLQWTIFEALALPAIALRGGYNKLFGLKSSEASSISGDALVSWGIRFFTAFAGYGFSRNEHQLQVDSNEGEVYGLVALQESLTEKHESLSNHRLYGFQIRVVPALLSVAFEWSQASTGEETLMGKLGLQI